MLHVNVDALLHVYRLVALTFCTLVVTQARHWLENAFRSRTAACVEGYVLNGPPVLETAVLLTKVLERSAMDALAKQLDWSVLKKFYLRGAEVCQQAFKLVDEVYTRPMATRTQGEILGEKQEEVLVASEKTATSTAIGPAVTARMYWHAAVVTSWQLDHRGAWHLLREGVLFCRAHFRACCSDA